MKNSARVWDRAKWMIAVSAIALGLGLLKHRLFGDGSSDFSGDELVLRVL